MKLIALVIGIAALGTSLAMASDCPAESKPVCAVRGSDTRAEFAGACLATRKGYKVLHAGHCEAPPGPSACTELYQPVCATDPGTGKEKTYSNLCHAEIVGAVSVHDRECTAPTPGG